LADFEAYINKRAYQEESEKVANLCMSKKQMSGEYLTAFAPLHDDDTGVSETASFIVIAGQSAILLPMV
jgi:hypothetical protein